MARQIIILENRKASDGIHQVHGFLWFPIVAINARVPKPGYVSLGVGLTGAAALTAAEQTALEDGSVREEGFAVQYPLSLTRAQIRADLVQRYTDRKAAIDAEPPTRRWYGDSYDGTVWST